MIYNFNLDNLNLKGVYSIKNKINDCVYIGSTTMTFKKRLSHHYWALKSNKHKNSHLQSAYNKYGSENFIVDLLYYGNTVDDIFAKEQEYLNNTPNKYNINLFATGTPNLSREVIEKRAATMRRRYANGEIKVHTKSGIEHHSYGKKLLNTDHLKVPKKKTDLLKQAWKNTSLRIRNNSPEVYVYDKDLNLLGHFNCSKDLEEISNDENFYLKDHMYLRNPGGRNGYYPHFLASSNIQTVANTNKQYKGLIFKNQPLHEEIHESESGEFRESLR